MRALSCHSAFLITTLAFSLGAPLAASAKSAEESAAKPKSSKEKNGPAPKFEGIGSMYIKFTEPQIVCRSREAADVINLLSSDELDEPTRKKVAPLAFSLCKPVNTEEPFEVVQLIPNEGTLEIRSTGPEQATGFLPINSMREEGVAFVLKVHPGLGANLKGLLDKMLPGTKKSPESSTDEPVSTNPKGAV
jgi:hypothetical protein